MPKTFIRLSGQWILSNNIFTKVGGAWQRIKTVWSKVNGVWVRTGGTVYLSINANVDNWNMRAAMVAAGYNPDAAPWQVEITVAPGVTVYSTSTSIPAMQIDALPAGAGINLINNGLIVGCAGAGGAPASVTNSGGFPVIVTDIPAQPGGAAGSALYIRSNCTVMNYGTIAGGGGGGGGAGANDIHTYSNAGEGRCGHIYSSGGYGGAGAGISAAGAGSVANSLAGGNGGGWGNAGTAGANGTVSKHSSCSSFAGAPKPGAVGGAGGRYVDGNAYVSWGVPGTRYGSIS
ncbi:hypothetical protein LH427_15915 [Laribacter hongkongensis]|uniref:hypothetical protein n=1 Tax=Laribacter hongkongensis TaxID=168471 RepID=UPI001EFDF271|nr:hypothetical protein [Laribacter hongkongensis]MCG8999781.1 hypothetical protein [Laribacter hongkongensis]MCG9063370.1 hypothetical protein [Laribacter hongkongensis]